MVPPGLADWGIADLDMLQSAMGLIAFTAIAWGVGCIRQRAAVAFPWRFSVIALALQIGLALLLTRIEVIRDAIARINDLVQVLQEATQAGTSFVFGYVGGGKTPFDVTDPASSFVLAFQAMPILLLMSALSALLFHWRILPAVVRGFAWVLKRSLRVRGSVGVGAAANIFVGMLEAPLLIRPYIRHLGKTDLFMVMTCGMATIAGTMMVLYATFLRGTIPDPAGQLLVASIISAPAALMVARLMVPSQEEDRSGLESELTMTLEDDRANSAMDAIVRGTLAGVGLLLNIIAMLMVMIALVFIANKLLGLLPAMNGEPFTLQRILGWVFAPAAWLMGLPWTEAVTGGALLGTKTILNELLAYLQLAQLAPGTLSDRSALILTYALCGFANFGSLGIMIGGMAGIAPERRAEIVELGGLSIVSGTFATMMTGAVIGLIS